MEVQSKLHLQVEVIFSSLDMEIDDGFEQIPCRSTLGLNGEAY